MTRFLPSPLLYALLSSCFLVPASHLFYPSYPIVFLHHLHWTTGCFPDLPGVPLRTPLACIMYSPHEHNSFTVICVFMAMRIPWRMLRRHATRLEPAHYSPFSFHTSIVWFVSAPPAAFFEFCNFFVFSDLYSLCADPCAEQSRTTTG